MPRVMTRAKTALRGRLQVGTVAGFKSESMADIKSVRPAGLRRNSHPERLDMRNTLERFVFTWPAGVRPKIHFSSPRTELREIKQKISPEQRASAIAGKPKRKSNELLKAPVRATARVKTVLRPPIWTGHADFTNPFEFATFMRMAEGLIFDVMMEGKSKDLSILRLRPDLLRFAPDVAAGFGISDKDAQSYAVDKARLDRGVNADNQPDVDEG